MGHLSERQTDTHERRQHTSVRLCGEKSQSTAAAAVLLYIRTAMWQFVAPSKVDSGLCGSDSNETCHTCGGTYQPRPTQLSTAYV